MTKGFCSFIIKRKICGSSYQEVFCKKGVHNYFEKFTEKHLCQSLRPEACNFIKKAIWHRCFPINFVKFFKNTFLKNSSGGCFWIWYLQSLIFKLESFTSFGNFCIMILVREIRFYESAKSRGWRGCVGWVGQILAWVTWVAWVHKILPWVAWVALGLRCFVLLLQISQNIQESTCGGVSC